MRRRRDPGRRRPPPQKRGSPVVEHPLPAFRRIQPVHGLAGSGAGPAEPGVAVQSVGQIGAVGRVTALILDQFRLLGEGHGGPEGVQGRNLRRKPRLPELGPVEAIPRQQRLQKDPQPVKLASLYPAAVPHPQSFRCRPPARFGQFARPSPAIPLQTSHFKLHTSNFTSHPDLVPDGPGNGNRSHGPLGFGPGDTGHHQLAPGDWQG